MATEDTPSTLSDYFGILRRRRKYLLTVLPATLLLSIYIAYSMTPLYRSSATILLEPASISSDLVSALSSYADQQFELVQRKVLKPDNLLSVVKKLDPYPQEARLSAKEKAQRIVDDTVIERVDPVTLAVLPQSTAFSIHYHNPDPELAAAIAQRLSNLFLSYNRQSRRERATAAYEFLLTQSSEVERRMVEVDKKIEQFKKRHPGALPDDQARNQNSVERASQILFDINAQIRRAEERRGQLEVQLSRLNPTLGTTTGNTQTELATLQGQLAEARVRYTPDHPDVKRLQRQIEALTAKAASDPGSGQIVPNNPDYIGIKGQLESTEREISALRNNAAREQARMYQLESGAVAAPAVEREFEELLRADTVLQRQFDDLHARLREADISRNLETEQRGDRFSQIRAPSIPAKPYSPNRIGIILLGIVLGAGLAIGLAALAESSDPTVRHARDLREVTGIPAIASVPTMFNDEARRKRLVWRASYACILFVATAFVAVIVATA